MCALCCGQDDDVGEPGMEWGWAVQSRAQNCFQLGTPPLETQRHTAH